MAYLSFAYCFVALVLVSFLSATFANQTNSTGLKCCVLHEPPYVVVEGQKRIKGIALDNFNRISDFIEQEDGERIYCEKITLYRNHKDPAKSGFDDAIDDMHVCSVSDSNASNCDCDINLSIFVINSRRRELIDTVPVLFTRYRLVTTVENAQAQGGAVEPLFIFKAFSLPVWGAIFVLFLLSCLTLFLIHKLFGPRKNANRAITFHSTAAAVQAGLSVGYDIPSRYDQSETSHVGQLSAPTFAQTLLLLTGTICLISGTFYINIYNAAVTAKLQQLQFKPHVQSIDDFKTCRGDITELVILKSAAMDYHLQRHVLNTPCHEPEKNPIYVRSHTEAMKVLRDNPQAKYHYTLDSIAEYETRVLHCRQLVTIGEPFFELAAGYVIPKGSPLKSKLMKAVTLLREQNDLIQTENIGRKCDLDNSQFQVGMRALILPFAISVGLLSVVAATALIRWVWVKRRCQSNRSGLCS